MAKKPPTELERIIMATDPKKAKEAIEFFNKQIAQGGGTPQQKKVMAQINSLKTDADKLAVYEKAKYDGILEYDFRPERGDVPRAEQEPWKKRDQRFFERKTSEFPELSTEEDFTRGKLPEPEVNKTRLNYDDAAPDPEQIESKTPTKADTYLEEVRPQFRKDLNVAKRALKMGESIEPSTPSEPPASTVKQRGIPTIKAKKAALEKIAGKSAQDQLLEREERNAELKAKREATRSGIGEMVQEEAEKTKMTGKPVVTEAPEVEPLKVKDSAPKTTTEAPKAKSFSADDLKIKVNLLDEIKEATEVIKEIEKKGKKATPQELDYLKETKKQLKGLQKNLKDLKNTSVKAEAPKAPSAPSAPSAPKTTITDPKAPTSTPTLSVVPDEPLYIKLNREIDALESLGKNATPEELKNLENKKIELEELKNKGRSALNSTPPSPSQPAQTTNQPKTKKSKTPEETVATVTEAKPTAEPTVTETPTTISEPEISKGPTVEEADAMAKEMHRKFAPPEVEPARVEPTTAPEPTVTPRATTVEPTVVEPTTTPKTTNVGQEQPSFFQKYLDAFGEGAVEDGTKATTTPKTTSVGQEQPRLFQKYLDAFGEGAPPSSPKSGGFSLTPEGISSGFKWAGRGLAGLDVAQNLREGDVGGAVVSGGLAALPEIAGYIGGRYAAAPTAVAAGVLLPTDTAKDPAEEGINNLIKLYNTAKTPEEKATLKEVIKRTQRAAMGRDEFTGRRKSDREIFATTPDKRMIEEAQTYTRPKELIEREQKAFGGLKSEDTLADFIGQAESRGDYNAVNKNSGAFGKYQILEKDLNGKDVHGKMVESRYDMPFKEAMAKPEIQEDYFRNVILPNYKIQAAQLAQTPEAKEMGLDEFTLTGMLQLGAGNVRKYLAGKANDNISKQMEYFKTKAEKYKATYGSGSEEASTQDAADILGFREKVSQLQESGNYLPYKSAQAKVDDLRMRALQGPIYSPEERQELKAKSDEILNRGTITGRMSPNQRRFQESETVTSDSFTPEQIKAAGISGSDEIPSQEQAMGMLKEAQPQTETATTEAPTTTTTPAVTPTMAPTRQRSRLEEALELQRQYELMAAMSRGSERLGRGIAGAISKVAPSKMSEGEFEQTLSRMGKTGVEGAKLLDEEEIKREESDPYSEKSKRARESLKSILGTELPESLSYNDIKTLKFSDLSLKTRATKTQQEKINTQRIDKLGKSLIAELQSKQQFGVDAKTLANVQNAEALLTGYKSLDDIPQAQIYEVARAVDRIVSQASPTISASKELTPETARSVLSKYISFASGRVTGAGVGEFLKNYKKLLDREKVQAQSRIKDTQTKIAAPYLDLWQTPEYKDRIRFIFQRHGLDADSMFETIKPEETSTSEDISKKPKIHPQSGIELYD